MSTNGIKVTDVSVFPLKKKNAKNFLQAYARVVLNDQFIINGLRIVNGKNGLFVSFPQEYNTTEKKGYDICHPITAELRNYLSSQVLSQFSIDTAVASAQA